MWVVAGVLLGLVVLTSLIGFHTGPHSHVVAGVLGILAAIWLVVMAADGRSRPVLWALFSADVVVSAGVGTAAWKALTTRPIAVADHGVTGLVGDEGIATSDLDPQGFVRLRGEEWSATSVHGRVASGSSVQVVRVDGLRLFVWGEDDNEAIGPPNFVLDTGPFDAAPFDKGPPVSSNPPGEGFSQSNHPAASGHEGS